VERGVPRDVAFGLFGAALIFHIALGLAMHGVLNMSWADAQLPAGEGFMKVALVPPDPDELLDPDEELTEEERQRLVQNHRLLNEDRPDESDKMSEFDHTIDEETRAQNVAEMQARPESRKGEQDSDEAKNEGEKSEQRSDSDQKAFSENGEGSDADDSKLELDEDGQVSKQSGASSDTGRTGLRGSSQDLARTFGRRGSLDYLEDVEAGAENLLNTKRTKFASFFNRVRNGVSQHWHPEVIHAARDPHGKIYGTKTRTTRLRISLNRDGSVHRIWVDRPSGVDYLDEEAIRAVRAAAPFTNPPRQLMDGETGLIDFSFNFILMIDGSKRIFRYKR
jgi:TonB family protein